MRAALLGCGTVGSGVYKIAQGLDRLEIVKILDRDPEKLKMEGVTDKFGDIVSDPSIDCVVEAMGGLHPAREYILASLEAGKHVVTANKAVVAAFLPEFSAAAKKSGVKIMVEATSGGGIPWIKNLQRAGRIDEISEIYGIMNGTSNYILSSMFAQGADFGDALAEAQRLGYAEADPSADIDGDDVRNKCCISASLAFGGAVPVDGILQFGIRGISRGDVDWCKRNGLVCKLFASARREGDAWCAAVEPVLLREGEVEAAVSKNFNITCLSGATIGDLKFYGQGAGSLPTGNAIVQDMLDIASGEAWPLSLERELCHRPDLLKGRYMLRFSSAAAAKPLGDMAERLEEDGAGRILAFTGLVTATALHEAVKKCLAADKNMFMARFIER